MAERTMSGIWHAWLGCACLAVVLWSSLGGAAMAANVAELALRPMASEVQKQAVCLTYQLSMKGMVPIRDELREGAHMLVEGTATLLRERTIRTNEELSSQRLEWIIRHDPLTRDFTVTNGAQQTVRGPHLDTVLAEAWRKLRVELRPEEPFEAGESYLIRMELVLRYAQVPPWLEKALFFWSWELSPKLEYEKAFVYQGNPADREGQEEQDVLKKNDQDTKK